MLTLQSVGILSGKTDEFMCNMGELWMKYR